MLFVIYVHDMLHKDQTGRWPLINRNYCHAKLWKTTKELGLI